MTAKVIAAILIIALAVLGGWWTLQTKPLPAPENLRIVQPES